jgi:hypothetical protein
MLGLALLTGMLSASMATAAGRPDGMIKDCSSDIGSEPNIQCGAFYASPDIYVRNSPGFVPVHQQPISGQPNWVYATVTNIGTSQLTDAVVHFYFAKASTGLFWSTSWINNFIGGIVYGDEIGSVTVPSLAPNTSANVGVQWNTVPNPANYSDPDARHFCLLARIESQQDPMTYAETSSIQANTQNNNNIAWKNCSIMDPVHPTGAIDIEEDPEHDGKTDLNFDAPQAEQGGNALEHVTIRVDLGEDLFNAWKEAGQDGDGVTTVDDAEHTIEITAKNAHIRGLNLANGTRYTAHVQVIYPQEVEPDLAGKVFNWTIEQVNQGGEVVGGEEYNIELPHDDGHPDAMIKDCLADVGNEPNSDCYAFYASPSIWVRNTQGAVPGHQSPITGQTNWVYVKITNIGNSTLNYGDLHLYFAKASTGLYWSTSWINDLLPSCLGGGGTTLYGDEITPSQPILNLLPGETRDIEFAWNTVPNPADFCDPDARHFCLMARFVSAEDPMAYPEGIWIGPNVQNNNNIAWKNCSILDAQHPHGTVDINKSPAFAGHTKLRFDVPEGEGDGNVLDHAQIQVDLGPQLFDTWKATGQQGEGVEGVGGENGTININDPHAWIGGLQLPDDVRLSIKVNVNYPADIDPTLAGTTFHWDIVQFNEETDELVGGERYDITMPGDAGKMMLPNGRTDLASALKLAAHPNPTSAGTTIGFILPSAGRISVAIYDASGRLVRQLINGADRAAGAQQVEWNGQSADGRRVASGTYICRISTPEGAAEQQIKVTR